MSTVKICIKCGVEKSLDEYHRNRKSEDGHCYECKACKKDYDRAWYVANKERVVETNRAWREANPERSAELNARVRTKYPGRFAARSEVNKAIMRGDFPPASALVCDYCQEAQAEHWHHHLGYAPEHALDAIAVCLPCHVELHKEAA